SATEFGRTAWRLLETRLQLIVGDAEQKSPVVAGLQVGREYAITAKRSVRCCEPGLERDGSRWHFKLLLDGSFGSCALEQSDSLEAKGATDSDLVIDGNHQVAPGERGIENHSNHRCLLEALRFGFRHLRRRRCLCALRRGLDHVRLPLDLSHGCC